MSIEDKGEGIMSEEIIRSPDTLRTNRIPPGQHSIDYWPVLHFGKTPTIETRNWTFKIFFKYYCFFMFLNIYLY